MEYKITVQVKDDRALVGLQRPDCDPLFEMVTLKGDTDHARLMDLGERLGALAAEAEATWAAAPKYPAYTPPKVETSPAKAKAKAEAAPKAARLPKEQAAPKEPEVQQRRLPF